MRPFFDNFLNEFVKRLSQEDDEKKAILLTSDPANETTACFNETMDAFYKNCVGKNVGNL